MSLQKGFFMTEPFNPSPFWDNTIVNLSGAQKFDENTVFPAGRYSVDVQAGSGGYDEGGEFGRIKSRKITKTFTITTPFCIRAYCGSKGSGNNAGVNPYTGSFKVNSILSGATISTVNHIFGNCGSSGHERASGYEPSGCNCLGNGIARSAYGYYFSTGAGSCLHFIPVGGTFGTDYLFAVHIASAGYGILCQGGGGSAYGGAASGGANSDTGHSATSQNGGSTPFGSGGTGVYAPSGVYSTYGNDGTGIGAGFAVKNTEHLSWGGAAYFNGTNWVDGNIDGLFGGFDDDGHIIVKYLGTLN